MDTLGIFETRKPGRGETRRRGFTYYWSDRSDITRLWEVTVGIFIWMPSLVAEVTPINESITEVRLQHTLDFISFVESGLR